MRILIVYASTEGQTRKICRFAARHLHETGHSVELLRADDAEPDDPDRADAVILAGSVHSGRVQEDLLAFGKSAAELLQARPSLYLQVSLAAAGDDPSEHVDLARIADGVAHKMGWTPDRTEHVAGAFRFTKYDFFQSWAMRYIAHQHGQKPDPKADTEFTDWEALKTVLDSWVQAATAGTPKAM